MGCDIHFRVERRPSADARWEVVKPGMQPTGYGGEREDWPTPRQYLFFARIADVRNYDPEIEAFAAGRGLPADMASQRDADEDFPKFEAADAAGVSNLGDHSFTWATLAELQRGFAGDLQEVINPEYRRLIFEEWPKLGDSENVRVIMGFDN